MANDVDSLWKLSSEIITGKMMKTTPSSKLPSENDWFVFKAKFGTIVLINCYVSLPDWGRNFDFPAFLNQIVFGLGESTWFKILVILCFKKGPRIIKWKKIPNILSRLYEYQWIKILSRTHITWILLANIPWTCPWNWSLLS